MRLYTFSKIAGPLVAILGFIFSINTASAEYIALNLDYSTTTNYTIGTVGTFSGTNVGHVSGGFRTFSFIADAPATSTISFQYRECSAIPTNTTQFGACTLLYSETKDIRGAGYFSISTSTLIEVNPLRYGVFGLQGYMNVLVYGASSTEQFAFGNDQQNNPMPTNWTPYYQLLVEQFNQGSAIEPPASLPVYSCSLTELSGCFKNAISWALFPSVSSFERFETLKDDIKDHAPFGYFTSAVNTISGISTTSTSTFALAEVEPIMDLIFTPLRNGLSWIIIFACLFWLYKRLTDIQI